MPRPRHSSLKRRATTARTCRADTSADPGEIGPAHVGVDELEEDVLERGASAHVPQLPDLVEGSLGQDPSVVDDRHLVAQALDHVEDMGREEQGHALPGQPREQVRHDAGGYGVSDTYPVAQTFSVLLFFII